MADRRRSLMALIGATALLAAIVPAVASAQERDRIIAADSSASIVLQRSWRAVALNTDAILQFGDSATESYVMVILDVKEDMVGWNLTRHNMVTLGNIMVNLDLPEMSEPVHVTIGGHPGVQREIRGTADGLRIAYLHTSIESPTTFAQVIAWTLSSRWKANEPAIRAAVESVELPGPIGAIPDDVFQIVPGVWSWESSPEPCTGLLQRFEIDEDRKSMRIHHSEPIESTTGEQTTVTNYVIEGSSPRTLHTYIPGESRMTDAGEPVKWDLIAVGRNRIVWHRSDWPEGGMTGMLRKCDESSAT